MGDRIALADASEVVTSNAWKADSFISFAAGANRYLKMKRQGHTPDLQMSRRK